MKMMYTANRCCRSILLFLSSSAFLLQVLQLPGVLMASTTTADVPYEYLGYDLMRAGLAELADQFPQVLLLETSATKLGVPYLVDCGEDLCVMDIVTVTDFKTS